MSQIMRRRLNITTVYTISKGIKKASMNAESHLNLNVLLEYFQAIQYVREALIYSSNAMHSGHCFFRMTRIEHPGIFQAYSYCGIRTRFCLLLTAID
jgi:hypothetical protein